MMEAKRYELERAIIRIKAVIARSNGEPDWDDVADILKSMQSDQKSDDGHFFALDHTFTYDKVEDLLKDLEKCIPNHKAFLENNESKIRKGLEKLLSAGSVKVFHDEGFWRLKKG